MEEEGWRMQRRKGGCGAIICAHLHLCSVETQENRECSTSMAAEHSGEREMRRERMGLGREAGAVLSGTL